MLSRNPWNISVFDQFSIFKMAPDLDYKRYGMYIIDKHCEWPAFVVYYAKNVILKIRVLMWFIFMFVSRLDRLNFSHELSKILFCGIWYSVMIYHESSISKAV